MSYVSDGASIDAGDNDGSVASDAKAEPLVVQFAQTGVARRVPFQLCRKQSQRSQAFEQIRHGMLAEIWLSERQLDLGRS